MKVIRELAEQVNKVRACKAFNVPRSSFYRAGQPAKPAVARPRPPRALSSEEQGRVLDLLHSPRFVDCAPVAVWATLLDEGHYHCSARTMYRLLEAHREVRDRRDQLKHPSYAKPELLAQKPNEVWTWDITELRGPVKYLRYYLYVILDLFSRYVVGWMVAEVQSDELAQELIGRCLERQGIVPGQLTIHSDRGATMLSKPLGFMLADLGILKSHSRPYCSNDNPFVESHFRTLKYRPEFPKRFGSIRDARGFCRTFFHWYHHCHRHSGLGWMTPHSVHHGQAQRIEQQRQRVLDAAYARIPQRFVRKAPRAPQLPPAVWINPPCEKGKSVDPPEPTRSGLGAETLNRKSDLPEGALKKRTSHLTCNRLSHEGRYPKPPLSDLQAEVDRPDRRSVCVLLNENQLSQSH